MIELLLLGSILTAPMNDLLNDVVPIVATDVVVRTLHVSHQESKSTSIALWIVEDFASQEYVSDTFTDHQADYNELEWSINMLQLRGEK